MTGGALHITIDHGDDRLLVVVHPTGEHEVAVDMGDHVWQPVEFVPEKVEVRAEVDGDEPAVGDRREGPHPVRVYYPTGEVRTGRLWYWPLPAGDRRPQTRTRYRGGHATVQFDSGRFVSIDPDLVERDA